MSLIVFHKFQCVLITENISFVIWQLNVVMRSEGSLWYEMITWTFTFQIKSVLGSRWHKTDLLNENPKSEMLLWWFCNIILSQTGSKWSLFTVPVWGSGWVFILNVDKQAWWAQFRWFQNVDSESSLTVSTKIEGFAVSPGLGSLPEAPFCGCCVLTWRVPVICPPVNQKQRHDL